MSILKSAGDIATSAQACNLRVVQAQIFSCDMYSDQVMEVMSARW
jgi:hypothetical protein